MRPLLLATVVALPAAYAAAAEPAPAANSLIRTWAYSPTKPLHITSVAGHPVVIVLQPGDSVLHRTGQKVYGDLKQATDAGGWYMPFNAFASEAPANGEADKGKPRRPDALREQITLQPTQVPTAGGNVQPVILQLMTLSAENERRPYVLVLHSKPGDVFSPKDGGDVQVIVTFPKPVDREAQAAAAAARATERERLREQRVLTRMAQARVETRAASGPDDWKVGDGRGSPGACRLLKPVGMRDDGVQTTLTFDPRQPKPKVYTLTTAGSAPTLVNTVPSTRPDGWFEYVLPGTYAELRIVAENQVCGLRNAGFNRAPVGNPGGTVSADVAIVPRRP